MAARAFAEKKAACRVLNATIDQVDGGAGNGGDTDGENRPVIDNAQPGQNKHIKTDIAAELGILQLERYRIEKQRKLFPTGRPLGCGHQADEKGAGQEQPFEHRIDEFRRRQLDNVFRAGKAKAAR